MLSCTLNKNGPDVQEDFMDDGVGSSTPTKVTSESEDEITHKDSPYSNLQQPYVPLLCCQYIDIFYLYIDSGIASGKTSLIKSLQGDTKILTPNIWYIIQAEPVAQFVDLLKRFYEEPVFNINASIALQCHVMSCLFNREIYVMEKLKHILAYITRRPPEFINDLERMSSYTHPCCLSTRHKVVIIQERSMIVSKEVFLKQLNAYVPHDIVTVLETIAERFISSAETQLKTLINEFIVEPVIFGRMNKPQRKINVVKRDVHLKVSTERAWCQYLQRSAELSDTMCTYAYFQHISDTINRFMQEMGVGVIVLEGEMSTPMIHEIFVSIINKL